jgi:hypothetical protein
MFFFANSDSYWEMIADWDFASVESIRCTVLSSKLIYQKQKKAFP